MRRFAALRPAGLIIALAAGLRLYHAGSFGGSYFPHADREEGYYEAAIAQLSCHVLGHVPSTVPSNFHAPLYPSFLALSESPFRRPTPRHPRLAQAAVATLGVATVVCLGWLVMSPLAGLLAGLLLALHVDSILAVSSLNVHGFYGTVMLAVGAAAVLWVERRTAWRAAALGLMIAASLLCRPAHFPLPGLLAGACFFLWKFPEGGGRALAPVAVAAVLFLAPMGLRNGLQFGDYSPFDLKGSFVLLRATTGPDVRTTVEQSFDAARAVEPGFTEGSREGRALHKELVRLALRQMIRRPFHYAWYCVQRLFFFWQGLWLYLALAAYALWRMPENRPLQALALVAASFSGYALAGGAEEYRVSAVPVLCVLAGVALADIASVRLGRKNHGEPSHRLRSAAAILPALIGLIYCGMLVLLALELKDNFRPAASDAARRLAPCPDGRALELLRLAAMHSGPRGVAADDYADEAFRLERPLPAIVPASNADRYLALWARSTERGESALAAELLRRAFESDPERTCERTPLRADRARFDPGYFDLCLGRFPEHPKLLADRGVARFMRGEHARAARDIARSYALRPSLETALSLATVLEAQARPGEALKALEAGLRDGAGKSSEGLASAAKDYRDRLLQRTQGR